MEPPTGISRRRFVTLSALGLTGLTLSACAGESGVSPAEISTDGDAPTAEGTGGAPTTTAAAGGTPVSPEVISSSEGLLEIDLVAAASEVPWQEGTRYAYTYNGTSPGPTLRLRPGDRLVIHLTNRLDSDTNLHTHGLYVSPEGNADNVFLSVAPGETQTYEYEIPPEHRSGLFWYHPHRHGTVADQVAAGLAGAIVVEDDLDGIGEIADSTERIWVLSDPPIGDGPSDLSVGRMDRVLGREGPTPLVNGVPTPTIEVRAGTLERWRLVNACSSRYFRLAVDDHEMTVAATDGGRLETPLSVPEVLLAPGERVELLITPTTAGSYAVRSLGYDRVRGPMGDLGGMGDSGGMGGRGGRGETNGTMMGAGLGSADEVVIASMVVSGDSAPASLPARLAPADSVALPEPTASRTLELGMGMGMGQRMQGPDAMVTFTIDGREFDAFRTDIRSSLGEVEDWTILNPTGMDHPFHLHVWNFQVLEGTEWAGVPAWKDTVNVPAGGQVRFRVPIGGIDGRTVYHCHILDHEDGGMMGVIEVDR